MFVRQRARPVRRPLVAALLVCVGCGGDPTAPDPVCGDPPVVRPGDTVRESLSRDDPVLYDARVDYYSLLLDEPAHVRVLLSSAEFDPLLYFLGPDQDILAQGFDPAGQPPGVAETASLIEALGAGCHLIGASAWAAGAEGTYTLRVVPLSAGPGP